MRIPFSESREQVRSLLKAVQIRQIFRSSAGGFVSFEVGQGDETDFLILESCAFFGVETIVEIHSVDVSQNLDSHRRDAHPRYLTWFDEVFAIQVGHVETEFVKSSENAVGVFRACLDPDIDIGGEPAVSVIGDGVAADHHVLNVVAR